MTDFVISEEMKQDIVHMKGTLKNIEDYNKKYHPEKKYDMTDVIQSALPACDKKTYWATAEYITIMLNEFCPISDELKKERERVLDEMGKGIDSGMISSGDCQYSDEPVVTVQALVKILESLRGEPIKDITVGNSGGNR